MTPQHYTTAALVPVANALRGVAAGYVTADTDTPGTLRPAFRIHDHPVPDDSIDGQVLHALYELGLITVTKRGVIITVSYTAFSTPTCVERSVDIRGFTVNARAESFDKTSHLLDRMR